MKKTIIFLIITVNIFCFSAIKLLAASEKMELKTSEATLNIDRRGNVKIVHNEGKILEVNSSVSSLWKIILINNTTGKEQAFIPEDNYTINKINNTIHIVVNNFSVENNSLPVSAEFSILVRDDAFCFSGSLKCYSDEWMLKELDFPNITGIQFKNSKAGIYWPRGLGEYFDNPAEFGSQSLRYPSGLGAAMGWFSVKSQDAGIYMGSHDPLQETKVFSLEYDKKEKVFNAHINSTIFDKQFIIPDIMIKTYSGEWYEASKFYRSWYDRHFDIVEPPEWVKGNSGWLLAILKQQNMEVMWPYKEIDKLCDIAEEYNLGTIGLFGWAVGGHDKYYPNYQPDNLMGGQKELEAAIERAHKKGKKIIIYANGHIMDTSTDYYEYNGFQTIVADRNMHPNIQYYHKQKTATPVIFAQACAGSEVWRKTMYELGVQAASLGADGILYDQVGIMGISLCYSENHDHRPGMSDARNRVQMIEKARETAREVNPEFIVMTEGTNDAILKRIDYHHGYGIGTAPSATGFPELYRYTFPELIATQRNPNPMLTRTDANFAAIYGLRHEIESRYPADVEYLLHGTLPADEDYSNINYPPSIAKMNLLPKDEAAEYVHTLIEFENNNSDFFRTGKFIDEEGIEVNGDDILAKGFANGNKIGVVVWNKHLTEKRNYSVSVRGYQLINAKEPDNKGVSDSSALDANSLRLLIFEKN